MFRILLGYEGAGGSGDSDAEKEISEKQEAIEALKLSSAGKTEQRDKDSIAKKIVVQQEQLQVIKASHVKQQKGAKIAIRRTGSGGLTELLGYLTDTLVTQLTPAPLSFIFETRLRQWPEQLKWVCPFSPLGIIFLF